MSTDKIYEFPLNVFGDQLTAALEQAGVPHGAVFVAVVNAETGMASTTSNMDKPDQIALLGWLRNNLIDGTHSEEHFDGGGSVQ